MSQKPLHPFFSLSFFLLFSCPFMSYGQGGGKSIDQLASSGRSVSGYRPSIDPALRKKASPSVMRAHKPVVSVSRPASASALPSARSAVPPKRPDPLDHIPTPLKSFYLAIADSTKPHQYDGSLPKAAHGLFELYQKHYCFLSPNEADFEAAALAYEAEDNRKKGIQPEAEIESKMASESRPTPFIQLLQKEFGAGAQSPLEEAKQKLMTIVMGLQSYRDYGFDMLLSKENGRSIVHNLYVMAFASLSNRLGGQNLDSHRPSRYDMFGAGAGSASAAASNSFQDFGFEAFQGLEPHASGGGSHSQAEALAPPSDLRRMPLSEQNPLLSPPFLRDEVSKFSMTSPSESVPDSGRSMLSSFGATDLTPSLLNTDPKPLDLREDSAPDSAASLSDFAQIDPSFWEKFLDLREKDRLRVRILSSLLLDGNSIPADFLSQLVALTPDQQQAFLEAKNLTFL